MLGRLALLCLFATSSLAAQIGLGEAGLLLTSGNASVGTVCPRVHGCAYLAGDLLRGQPADFLARGVQGRPWAIALGFDVPHQCLTVPGIHNQLMSAVVFVPWSGVMTEPDRILACPGGVGRASLQVPASLPLGSVLTFQALVWSYLSGNESPTFTTAIRATVR